MSNERISVRKIREVLRHRFTLTLSRAQTALALGIGRTTVREYEARFAAAGLSWPLPETINDAELEAQLFAAPAQTKTRPLPPFEHLAKEMLRPNVTLALLWEEYKKSDPGGYQYSQFAKLYRNHQKTLTYSMRQEHKAGEKGFVDFGEGLFITEADTGRRIPTDLFVYVWGASSCLFAEATLDQSLKSWIGVHVSCFEYFGCAPKAIVPDNLKSAVSKHCRYEPDLNPTYADMAQHYGLCVLPARPRRPKDKSKVENGVLLAKRWILARLRDRVFYNLADLNQAIRMLVQDFNGRPLKRLKTTRQALFLELDKPNALALPPHPYEFAQWKHVRVGVNYHVEFDRHFYSVPYTLIHQELEVRATASVVEIHKDGRRILSHPRSLKKHGYTTVKDHMPPSHQKYIEWTPDRILRWAEKYGPSVKTLVERIMSERSFPEQAYKSCLGIIRLANRYDPKRLETACQRALRYHMTAYRGVRNILDKGLDQKDVAPGARVLIHHENLRGPEYYHPA
jgi:transposase